MRAPRDAPRRAVALLTIVLAAACGKPEEGPRSAAPPASGLATIDSTPEPADPSGPGATPVSLPPDVPLPPGAEIVSVAVDPEEDGVLSRATLVTAADGRDTVEWYAGALRDAGWQVAAPDSADGRIVLSAIQGESYADFEFRALPGGGLEIRARIWKTGR